MRKICIKNKKEVLFARNKKSEVMNKRNEIRIKKRKQFQFSQISIDLHSTDLLKKLCLWIYFNDVSITT